MPAPVIAAVASPIAGALIGKAVGGDQKTQALVPPDLAPMRHNQIQLLNYLTGFGGVPDNLNLPQHMASGGPVQGPGGPTGDQVPALLSNGETVLNAGATKLLGPHMLALFNHMGAQHLALGGPVLPPPIDPNAGRSEGFGMGTGAGGANQQMAGLLGGQKPSGSDPLLRGTQHPGADINGAWDQNAPMTAAQIAFRDNPANFRIQEQSGPTTMPANPQGGAGLPSSMSQTMGGRSDGGMPGQAGYHLPGQLGQSAGGQAVNAANTPPTGPVGLDQFLGSQGHDAKWLMEHPGQMVQQGQQFGQQLNASHNPNTPWDPTSRLSSYFGNFSVPTNPLQDQASGAMSKLLTQQSPEQRAFEAGQTALGQPSNAQNRLNDIASHSGLNAASQSFYQNLLGGQPNLGPGQGVQDALSGIMGNGGGNGDIMKQIMSNAQGGGQAGNEQFLQQMLRQNPANGVQQLLDPTFQQNLNAANQSGGRFGSANALMRGNAVAQNQAQLAQMMGQGVNQQLTAAGQMGQQAQANRSAQLQALMGGASVQNQGVANQLNAANSLGGFNQQGAIAGMQGQLSGAGALGSLGLQDIGQQASAANSWQNNLLQALGLTGQLGAQAGNAARANIGQGFNMGSALAGQSDIETQRRIQMLMAMMGQAQGASMNVPTQVTPSGAQQGAQIGSNIGNTLATYGAWDGTPSQSQLEAGMAPTVPPGGWPNPQDLQGPR